MQIRCLLIMALIAGLPAMVWGKAAAKEAGPAASQPAGASDQSADAPGENGARDQPNGKSKDEPGEDPKELEEFIRGANLETDSEVQALIRRAREHLDEKRFREAVTILQHVIDRPDRTLSTTDGRVYRSTRAVATEIVAALPKEGLEVYRLWADGEAKGLVGDVSKCVDAGALEQVVRRFFLSSIGDDAALRLASLALDRHDYGQARRLLWGILNTYPDPSVDRSAVVARLLLACARLNDKVGAAAAWAKLSAIPNGSLSSTGLAVIEREMKAGADRREQPETDWTMAFGSPRRRGYTADLPAPLVSSTEKLWTVQWEQVYATDVPLPAGVGTVRPPAVAGRGTKRDMLLGWWEENKAVPACQAAVVGDRVFFKGLDALVCCDLRTGKRLWEVKEQVAADPRTTGTGYYPYHYQLGDTQALFVDQLARSVSVIDGRVYHIEENSRAEAPMRVRVMVVNGRPQPAPMPLQGNALSAHDAATGKRVWRLGRESDEKKPFAEVRFLSPPTACLGRLLVPVDDNGELSLVALNPSDGTLVWKTFLCTSVSVRARATRPVGVWVDGTEVLVSSGRGVIFAIDGADGSMLWASRYQPAQAKEGDSMAMFLGRYRGLSVDGWQESYITTDGNLVVTAPADAETVLAFDRRSGKFVFSKEVKGPRYCLGVYEGGLFVATAEGMARIDLAKQDYGWTQKMSDVRGRAALAGDAIYVPTGTRIVRLDAKTGKRVVELNVQTANNDPLGNLMVVGDGFVATGMDRVGSLVNAKALFDDLSAKIAAKADATSLIERGQLHRDAGRVRECIEDLKRAHGMLAGDAKQNDVRAELVRAYLTLAKERPAEMEACLGQAAALAQTPGERAAVAMTRAELLAEAGKAVESAKAWRDVALSGGSELLPSRADAELASAPWVSAAAALREVAAKNAAARGELAGMAESTVAQAMVGTSMLEWLPAVRTFAALGSFKGVREGLTKLRSAGNTEAAEALLADLADDADPAVASAAVAWLAEMYQGMGWRAAAREEWERLARRFGKVAVAGIEGQPLGADLAKKRLAELADAVVKAPELGKPPWEQAWFIGGDNLSLLLPNWGATPALGENLFVQAMRENVIRCHGAADGKLVWQLALPKAGAALAMPRVGGGYYGGQAHGALTHERHTGFVRSGRGLIAYSLLNGKVLWEQKDLFNDSLNVGVGYIMHAGAGLYGDGMLSAGSGVVAVKVSPQVVRVVDLATGAVRWERSFNRSRVQQINVRNGYVLITSFTVQPNGAQLPRTAIYDRMTGKLVGQTNWDNRAGGPALWMDWGCIYVGYTNGAPWLTARDIPSGEARWSVDLKAGNVVPSGIEWHWDSDGQPIVVTAIAGGAAVVDATTGKLRWSVAREAMNAQVLGMRVGGNSVTVITRYRYDGKTTRQSEMKVATMSLADGKLEREQVVSHAAHANYMVAPTPMPAGNWLPIAQMQPMVRDPKKPGEAGVQKWTVQVHPVGDREGVPQALPMPRGKDGLQFVRGPMVMMGEYLLVVCNDGVLAYASANARRPDR